MNTEQDGRDPADYPALSFGFVYSQIIISKCKLSELGDQLVPFLRTQLFWSDQEKYSCLKVWHWKVVPFLSTMRVPTSFHQTKFQIQRAKFIWETPIGGIFHPKFQVNLTMYITNFYTAVYFRWIWPCGLQGEENKVPISLRRPSTFFSLSKLRIYNIWAIIWKIEEIYVSMDAIQK